MPPVLPKAVQALLTPDTTTTRALTSLKGAVDPLLSLFSSTFALAADGTLSFLRGVRTFVADSIVANSSLVSSTSFTANGKAAVNGAQTVTGTQAVSGTQTVTGTQTVIGSSVVRGSSVIQKADDGTQGGQLVQGDFTCNGAINSSTGFKSVVPIGYVYVGSATANTKYVTQTLAQNSSSTTSFYAMQTVFQPRFAGSLLALHYFGQSATGGFISIHVFKNTTSITGTPYLSVTPGTTGNLTGGAATFAKGTYTFVNNDYFTFALSWSVGGNQAALLDIQIEASA